MTVTQCPTLLSYDSEAVSRPWVTSQMSGITTDRAAKRSTITRWGCQVYNIVITTHITYIIHHTKMHNLAIYSYKSFGHQCNKFVISASRKQTSNYKPEMKCSTKQVQENLKVNKKLRPFWRLPTSSKNVPWIGEVKSSFFFFSPLVKKVRRFTFKFNFSQKTPFLGGHNFP